MANIKCCVKCGYVKFMTFSRQEKCKYCNTPLIETKYTFEDSLQQDDSVTISAIENEYVINNPEFSQEARQKRIEQDKLDSLYQTPYTPPTRIECPYCRSYDVKKITTAGRAVSVGVFGIASGKIGKQWHCNKCKSDF